MRENELWNLFKETGEPMCWLLARAKEREVGGKLSLESEFSGGNSRVRNDKGTDIKGSSL